MDEVCLVDTETTGLDPSQHRCIEVAAVRYSLAQAQILECYSALIDAQCTNEAEPINKIPSSVLSYGCYSDMAWSQVVNTFADSEAVLAHNADFDRQWVPDGTAILRVPWIDTCDGITWPKQTKPGSSLITLALDHGLGVADAHRALTDCLLLARLLSRCAELGHDLNELLAPGLRPRALFQALVSFEDKDKAKAAGFHWEGDTKRWLRKMAIEDAQKLPFRVKEVQP